MSEQNQVDELEQKVNDLVGQIETLQVEMLSANLLIARMLGMVALQANAAPDVGVPDCPSFTSQYENEMQIILRYNAASGHA